MFNEEEYEGVKIRFCCSMKKNMRASGCRYVVLEYNDGKTFVDKGGSTTNLKEGIHVFLTRRISLGAPKMETPLRVVTKREDHVKLMFEFHKSPWARHRGIWATFEKLKGKYWWP